MAKTIPYADYLKLTGLLVLSAEHNRALTRITQAAASIVGEEPDYGYYNHVSDQTMDESPDVDQLLADLDILVEKEA